MIIVMVINIISPHIGSLLQYRSHRKKIRTIESSLTPDQETDDKIRIWYVYIMKYISRHPSFYSKAF